MERILANPSLLILAGDGIGPEVMAEVKKIIAWFGTRRGIGHSSQQKPLATAKHNERGL